MIRLMLIAVLLICSLTPAHAAGVGGMFDQGHSQVSVAGGTGYAFDNSYFILGASVGYYVLDGFAVGMSLEKWSGNIPGIIKYAPFVQYVFYYAPDIHPYVGAFYRHTSIDGLPGINSIGERAGINIATQSNAYVNLGFVQEFYLGCQVAIYRKCKETYPDIGLTLSF